MGVSILVIEDNPTNLDLISYLLRAYGHDVLCATDGSAGIAAAQQTRPDLIICDIQMPGIDGYEVARRLRAAPATAGIPLVAVTALAMVDDRRKVMEADFDGYIAKPIEPETFLGQVAKFIPGHAADVMPPRAETKPRKAVPPGPPSGGATVLVVDNSRDNIAFVRAVLEASGYRVVAADNIAVGLALARRDGPALILSDLHMPGGSGFDLLTRIKADAELRAIPFVCLSSTIWADQDTVRATALGAERFLARPIEPQTLLDAVGAILGGARS